MKLLVITAPGDVAAEVETINTLFSAGLDILHLRKPGWSGQRMVKLLDDVDCAYHDRIMIHSNHELMGTHQLRGLHFTSQVSDSGQYEGQCCRSRSCHSMKEVEALSGRYDYLFISPVFDSVSKKGYRSAFSLEELGSCTQQTGERLVALGGITRRTLPGLSSALCWGAAVLGTVWQQNTVGKRLNSFLELKEIAALL